MKKNSKGSNLSIGTWVQTGDSTVCEILAYAGFDWVCIDLEHGAVGWDTLATNIRAIKRCGAVPYVRVTEAETMSIRKPLDCGALGVIVPMINNAETAARAVAAAKYAPQGIRGYAFCQANEWGRTFDSYVKSANDTIKVIVMIETKDAVENIDEILSVPGVDGIFIGPYDLSGSYGIPGQISDPIILAAKKTVLEACKRLGKTAGQHIVAPSEETIHDAIKDGYEFLALGLDTVFLVNESSRVMGITNKIIEKI